MDTSAQPHFKWTATKTKDLTTTNSSASFDTQVHSHLSSLDDHKFLRPVPKFTNGLRNPKALWEGLSQIGLVGVPAAALGGGGAAWPRCSCTASTPSGEDAHRAPISDRPDWTNSRP